MKIHIILLLSILPLFIGSYSYSQKPKSEIEIELRKAWDFDNWEGKNKYPKNGIDLSMLSIPSLSDLNYIPMGEKYSMSGSRDTCELISSDGKWAQSDTNYVIIDMDFAYSNSTAHQYLIESYSYEISASLELIVKSKDNPTLVGDISLFKGRVFVRNNTIITIYPHGNVVDRTLQIAKEIDAAIMRQKEVKDTKLIRPKLIKDKNRFKDVILEPIDYIE